jgi:hypothetical protein
MASGISVGALYATLASPFCGAGSDARRNILMVLKRPVPEDQYPQAIRGMGYIPFFEIDRESRDLLKIFKPAFLGRVTSDESGRTAVLGVLVFPVKYTRAEAYR